MCLKSVWLMRSLSPEKQQTSKSHQSKSFDHLLLNAPAQGKGKKKIQKVEFSTYRLFAGLSPRRAVPRTVGRKHTEHRQRWSQSDGNSTAVDTIPPGFKSAMTGLAWIAILHLAIPESHQSARFQQAQPATDCN